MKTSAACQGKNSEAGRQCPACVARWGVQKSRQGHTKPPRPASPALPKGVAVAAVELGDEDAAALGAAEDVLHRILACDTHAAVQRWLTHVNLRRMVGGGRG